MEKSAIARRALVAFLIGTSLVVALDAAENLKFVSELTESGTRLVIVAAVLLFVALDFRKRGLERGIVLSSIACGVLLLIDLALGASDDFVRNSPDSWFQRHSSLTNFVQTAVVCGGILALISLIYTLARSLENARDKLRVGMVQKSEAFDELMIVHKRLADAMAELKDAERAVVQQERLNALGQMAGGIAHDLNNTLTPVVAYCELLRMNTVSADDQAEMLAEILAASRHAANVVQQLQFFYRREKNEHEFETLDVRSLVQETIALTRPKWRGRDSAIRDRSSIDLKVSLATVPPLRGSEVELKQVLANLILNAVDAVDGEGEISIESRVVDRSVQIDVSDTGAGMTAETQQRCFEPFYTTKELGVGLGLSVCHGIVQRHGGTIEVVSSEGTGTTFRMTLPCADTSVNTHRVDATPTKWQPSPSSSVAAAIRILYIEDDPSVRSAIAYRLRREFGSVTVASSGDEGLMLFDASKHDVVISDFGMPSVDGKAIVTRIKADAPNVPVILVSGWSVGRVRAQLSSSEPDCIVQKPIEFDHLIEQVRKLHGEAETRLARLNSSRNAGKPVII